jgi:condensin-2 complex subunit D3
VRKAALVALSRLLEIFPTEPLLCSAWVRAALPLVRDTESSIQECLLDWTAALLMDKAAEARKAGSDARGGGRRGGGRGDVDRADVASVADTIMTEVDEEDIGAAVLDLRPLLAATAAAGRSAAACLGRLCGLLAGKKKLKPAFVAAGLLVVIQSSGMGSREALGGWLLLKEVTAQDPKAPCWQLLQQRWRALQAAAAAYAVEGLGVAGAAVDAAQEEGAAAGTAAGAAGSDQHDKLSAVAEEGAALLLVISNAAESFPDGQAAELADELLKVRWGGVHGQLASYACWPLLPLQCKNVSRARRSVSNHTFRMLAEAARAH